MAKTAHERLAEAQKALADAEARAKNPKIPLAKQRQCKDTVRHLKGEVVRLEREANTAPTPTAPVPDYQIVLGRVMVGLGMF